MWSYRLDEVTCFVWGLEGGVASPETYCLPHIEPPKRVPSLLTDEFS